MYTYMNLYMPNIGECFYKYYLFKFSKQLR